VRAPHEAMCAPHEAMCAPHATVHTKVVVRPDRHRDEDEDEDDGCWIIHDLNAL
jgi:hypothetical protein